MRINFASSAATLSVLGFFAWVSIGVRSESSGMVGQDLTMPTNLELLDDAPRHDAPIFLDQPLSDEDSPFLQERSAGSAIPCAVPLGWYIARVDESFDLNQAGATEAVRQAVALWEAAMDRVLFSRESGGELPIRFVYDDRQERSQERSRLEREFNEASARLDVQRVGLDERSRRYDGMLAQYEEDMKDLNRRVAVLNDSIRFWNARGGALGGVLSGLEDLGRRLDTERMDLTDRHRQIDEVQRQLAEDSEAFNRAAEAQRTEGEALEAAFPGSRVQSGAYREAVHTQDGRVTSITREIRVYRFDGEEDLVRVVAHELGHALGLGHSDVPRALMREEFAETVSTEGGLSVQPTDIEALRALCPAL